MTNTKPKYEAIPKDAKKDATESASRAARNPDEKRIFNIFLKRAREDFKVKPKSKPSSGNG